MQRIVLSPFNSQLGICLEQSSWTLDALLLLRSQHTFQPLSLEDFLSHGYLQLWNGSNMFHHYGMHTTLLSILTSFHRISLLGEFLQHLADPQHSTTWNFSIYNYQKSSFTIFSLGHWDMHYMDIYKGLDDPCYAINSASQLLKNIFRNQQVI